MSGNMTTADVEAIALRHEGEIAVFKLLLPRLCAALGEDDWQTVATLLASTVPAGAVTAALPSSIPTELMGEALARVAGSLLSETRQIRAAKRAAAGRWRRFWRASGRG